MQFTVVDTEPEFHTSSHAHQKNPLKQAATDLAVGQWLQIPAHLNVRSVRTMVSTLQRAFPQRRAYTVRKDRRGVYWIGRLPDPEVPPLTPPRPLSEVLRDLPPED